MGHRAIEPLHRVVQLESLAGTATGAVCTVSLFLGGAQRRARLRPRGAELRARLGLIQGGHSGCPTVHKNRLLQRCVHVCVYYCSTNYKAVRVGGGG